jgi:hypothetical protein
MATFITLFLMVAIFISVLYLGKYAWHHWGERVAHHDLPVKPMLLISILAGLLAVAGGVTFLRVMVTYAPHLTSTKSKVKARPQQFVTKLDLGQQKPRIKVVVNDSDDDVPLPGDLLRRCADVEITYITSVGNVQCFAEGSPEALKLLQRNAPSAGDTLPRPEQHRQAGKNPMKQGFLLAVSTTPTEVAKDVAARTGINRYAEVIYFLLTFLGVLLRIYWDASQQQKQESKPALLTVSSMTTGLVLAVATYALVIQSGLTGASDMLNFRTGIFAVYNGILSSTLLKDIAAFRTASSPQPVVTPPVATPPVVP